MITYCLICRITTILVIRWYGRAQESFLRHCPISACTTQVRIVSVIGTCLLILWFYFPGGNFGDLYRQHSEFRRIVIESYPRNKVIILPQTIFYEDKELISEDARFYVKYPNVTICAREKYSYDLLKAHFSNPCLLVPDMAFFINLERYKLGKETDKVLYLKRIDKEL